MSLFEHPAYQWRETFFILFDNAARPTTQAICEALSGMSGHFQPEAAQSDAAGQLESITVYATDDSAAMDITCVNQEEVREQLPELIEELSQTVSSAEERAQLKRLATCSGRIDVYHFGKRSAGGDEDDELVDPAGILALLGQLAQLVDGLVVDPQTSAFVN